MRYILDNFEIFSTRKFAITILPSYNVAAPLNLSSALPASTKLVYLKYYRALSDFCVWINGIVTGVWLKIVYSSKCLAVVDSPKVPALVLLIRDSLLPYVTSVPISNSVTCVSIYSLHLGLSIITWIQLFQDVYIGNVSFLLDFPQYTSLSLTTFSTLNFNLLVPE